jgi:hypothetical protein
MDRKEVYNIIDSERDYQDKELGNTGSSGSQGNGERTIDEFICYVNAIADEMQGLTVLMNDPKSSFNLNTKEVKLGRMRKIAALCVQCMEQHGGIIRFGG